MTPEQNPSSPTLDRALALVRFLRARCPWDAGQTPESLLPYLLEEAHEVAEAVAQADDDSIAAELGDLLLNVAFQVVLAEERGSFSAEDVVRRLESKMRRRHPHLYGDGPAVPWEQLKAREREDTAPDNSILEGVARGLEPLSKAQRLQDRVSAVGFDWRHPAGAIAKVREEIDELTELIDAGAGADPAAIDEEVGDLLFSVVNAARLAGVHAMTSLRRANQKFERRFRSLEELARQKQIDLAEASLEEMDALWDQVKSAERPS